jgi:mRNA interferase RelE/StbE
VFDLRLLESAETALRRIDGTIARRIMRRLRWLADNFEQVKPEALTGELAGLFKFRVGDYRAIYQPIHDERILVVHLIGHRRDIYR